MKETFYYSLTRLLAFFVDLLASDIIFLVAIKLSGHELGDISTTFAITLSLILCFAVIEPVLLSIFGNTLGNKLMKVSIRNSEGHKLGYFTALGRSVTFLIIGIGLGVNIIATAVLLLTNYFYLFRNGEFLWDKWFGTDVSQENPSTLKILIALIIVAFVLYLGYSASNSSTKVASLNIQTPHKKPQFTVPEYGYIFTNGKYQNSDKYYDKR
jgi:uncharacterized RDD family membrane protein YckC